MRKILASLIIAAAAVLPAVADDGNDIDIRVAVGVNLGGTTPMGLPAQIRGIDGYNPKFNPSIGIYVSKMLTEEWGVGTGIAYDKKGMKAEVDMRNQHLSMSILEGDKMVPKTGYYTGKVKNNTSFGMLTLPVYALWHPADRWKFKGGVYLSYAIDRKFIGHVYDGQIRETPLMPLIAVTKGEYDYSDDLNRVDFGLTLGAGFDIYRGLEANADLSWGFLNMLNKETRKVDMNTYNIYLRLGLSYNFNL